MIATLLKTENEEGGVAVISLNGMEVNAMDCLEYGGSDAPYPKVGDRFTPRFSCLFDDDETWDSVFGGNPGQKERLESTGLWSYKAFGKIVTIDGPESEAQADCGGFLIPIPIEVSSDEYIGRFVAFSITRLDVWRA